MTRHHLRLLVPCAVLALLALLWPCRMALSAETTWRPLRIGGGGYITSLDIAPDGSTRVIRTDTYGAYLWDAAKSEWRQLVTASSMPAPHLEADYNTGVYEIRVAPDKPTRLYMAYRGYIYRSDDRGAHWTQTAFRRVEMDANDGFRMGGQKLAVDPHNADVVYAGTAKDGLFVTRDAGATWQSIGAVPKSKDAENGGNRGFGGIAIDPASGAIYAPSSGNGVYLSVDGGATWAIAKNGPAIVSHGKIATDGAYYATATGDTEVWRYWQGAWTNITPERDTWQTVVVDPFDPARIIAIREGGYLDISHDRGATWDGKIWGPSGRNNRDGGGIGWLAWTNEEYMSVGEMMMDPVKAGRLWFAEGIGVWFTDLPADPNSPPGITFTAQSQGIEQLVATNIVAPPGGKPVVAAWDRPVFHVANPDAYPETHGPDNAKAIMGGWALDYASSDPSFLAGLFSWGEDKSGVSKDGGRTWTPFASYPPLERAYGGSIAAASPENMVLVGSDNQSAYVTTTGGAAWSEIVLPGVPATGETGWGFAHYLNRHIVAADRVRPGTFYLYNYLKGLFRSSDGGLSWTLVRQGELTAFSGYHAKLRSVPGKAGHLFFSAGTQSGNHPARAPLIRSSDGGSTWSAVPNVLEVLAFGFGKEAKPGGYPAIFIAGWVNRTYGLWRSDDDAVSWVKIGDYPLGSLDEIRTLEGDKTTFGTVYVGFSGSGFAYGVLQ